MATHRVPVAIVRPDAGCPLDLIASQITEAATPSIGDLLAYVLADGGTDEGVWIKFTVPKNYVGTPVLVIRGMLDGAPSAGHDLGFGFRKRAVADNESADGSFDAEQTFQSLDISTHADEDEFEATITLTGGDYAVDDSVFGYVYIDASGTTYTGNFLLYSEDSIFFQYADS
jgi:hypothetical protein